MSPRYPLLALLACSGSQPPLEEPPPLPSYIATEREALEPASTTSHRLRVLSTIYYPGDGHSGKYVACKQVALERWGTHNFSELVKKGVPIAATRWKRSAPYFKCGDWILVTNPRTGQSGLWVKIDSGPWSCYQVGEPGFILAPGKKCPSGWGRRSFLDLLHSEHTPDIGHTGLQEVLVEKVHPGAP